MAKLGEEVAVGYVLDHVDNSKLDYTYSSDGGKHWSIPKGITPEEGSAVQEPSFALQVKENYVLLMLITTMELKDRLMFSLHVAQIRRGPLATLQTLVEMRRSGAPDFSCDSNGVGACIIAWHGTSPNQTNVLARVS